MIELVIRLRIPSGRMIVEMPSFNAYMKEHWSDIGLQKEPREWTACRLGYALCMRKEFLKLYSKLYGKVWNVTSLVLRK